MKKRRRLYHHILKIIKLWFCLNIPFWKDSMETIQRMKRKIVKDYISGKEYSTALALPLI
jgi:hypothetical protein